MAARKKVPEKRKRTPKVKRCIGKPVRLTKEAARKVSRPATSKLMNEAAKAVFGALGAVGDDRRVIEHALDMEPQATEPPYDPWAHRSAGMRCSTCMWSVAKGSLGRCRRHAPTLGGYPVIYPDDWCGDHKLDETKVAE